MNVQLRQQVEQQKDRATIVLFREAKRLGLLGDPFVNRLADALGEISLDEALKALRLEAAGRFV